VNPFVRTALADLAPERLGRTDYHEHLFQASRLLPGDDLDDEERSGDEALRFREAGMDALIEATPAGLGRDPAAAARVSARTGLHVVLATGAHRHEHYAPGHWLLELTAGQLAVRFSRELREALPASDRGPASPPAQGPDGAPLRAGLLKAGIGYWSFGAFERRVLDGVAAAHADTGAPVMIHTEHGSAALEVLDLLAAAGVAAGRVVLAHMDRNPDPGLHLEVAGAGAYLGYDGMARSRNWPDSALIDCLVRVAAGGGADRLLLGGDVARSSRFTAYGGMPGLSYLPSRFVPRLLRETGQDLVGKVLVANPARLFAWRSSVATVW
jgi:5-phospho-D-xylono-1,4-lactonase